ncbi:MAG: PEGA domain-containing protein [Phycisphaerae bacterium]|nr:PEGA domain-containing protein [Phycisphaerae bacterium]
MNQGKNLRVDHGAGHANVSVQTMEGLTAVINPLNCERCGRALESDDAVSMIEGVCLKCRQSLSGIVQPLRADQLISGKTTLDEDDEFLSLPRPRFRAISSQTSAANGASANSLERTAANAPRSADGRGVNRQVPVEAAVSSGRTSIMPSAATQAQVAASVNDKNVSTVAPPGMGAHSARRESTDKSASTPIAVLGDSRWDGKDRRSEQRVAIVASGTVQFGTPRIRGGLRGIPGSEEPAPKPAAQSPSLVDRPKESAERAAAMPHSASMPISSCSQTALTDRPGSCTVAKDASTMSPTRARMPAPELSREELEDRLAAAALSTMASASPKTLPNATNDAASVVVPSPESKDTPRSRRHFHPPTPPFSVEGTPRYRRRKRDLLVGITVGLLLTFTVAYYAIRMRSPAERLAIPATFEVPSPLTLTISPPFAEVKLDGEPVGRADSFGRISIALPVDDLDSHLIEISAPGYHPVAQAVSTYLGAPDAYVSLMRMPYDLSLTTIPPNAQVWIDGEMRGTSPLTLSMDPTKSPEMTIRHDGYADLTQRVSPPEVGDALAMELELRELGRMLAVETEPAGATIRINGRLAGVAPLRVEMEPGTLGKRIEIAAVLDGYDNAQLWIDLPEDGGGDDMRAKIALARTLARINVYTDPPGGRVVVAGRDLGTAPVTMEFAPEETGKTVLVEASTGGTHFGRQEIAIPPAGEPTMLMIPLSFGAQRVVFAMSSPVGNAPDHFAMIDQLTRQIQSLGSGQRFAIIAVEDDTVTTWPGGLTMESATSEQKVRAYDMVRAVRPTHVQSLDALLRATLAFEPTSVWLFIDGEIDRAAFERFSEKIGTQSIGVNIVRATPPIDETWLSSWAAAHRGTFSLIGRDTLSALAGRGDSDAD